MQPKDRLTDFDIYEKLHVINESMNLGRTVGRRPKIREEHLTVLLEVMQVFIDDINNRKHQKLPGKREVQTMVQAVQWVGRVRKYYMQKGVTDEPQQ